MVPSAFVPSPARWYDTKLHNLIDEKVVMLICFTEGDGGGGVSISGRCHARRGGPQRAASMGSDAHRHPAARQCSDHDHLRDSKFLFFCAFAFATSATPSTVRSSNPPPIHHGQRGHAHGTHAAASRTATGRSAHAKPRPCFGLGQATAFGGRLTRGSAQWGDQLFGLVRHTASLVRLRFSCCGGAVLADHPCVHAGRTRNWDPSTSIHHSTSISWPTL